ncbi:MAG: TrmH family RNA methyltransferase [Vicinamibacterales bacterium]
MIPVADLADPRVQAYRLVADPHALEARNLFVAEGRLVVPRLLEASARPGRWRGAAQSVLLSPAAFAQLEPVVSAHPDVPVFVVPQSVMDGVVGFNIHRGCLALARRPEIPALTREMVDSVSRVVVLEGVNNPDNIGGVFRGAAALGAELVVLGPACGDPLYRKAVRTSMGTTLEVPFARAEPWPGALALLRDAGLKVIALTPETDALPLPRLTLGAKRVALVAGAEGSGLSEAALAAADVRVTIPMSGRVDSLNVSTAVAIALYHVGVSVTS